MKTLIKKFFKKLGSGVIIGIGMTLGIGIIGIVYATWTNLPTQETGDPLTKTIWNDMINKVNYIGNKSDLINSTSVTLSTGQNIPTTTWTIVNRNIEEFDDMNWHNNTTNNSRITVTTTGRYRVTTSACFGETNNGAYAIDVFKNGTSLKQWGHIISSGSYGILMQCANNSFLTNLNSGDYLEIKVLQGTGSPFNLLPNHSFFQIEQIK